MYELSIRGDIAAAHFIEGHQGKCKNLHGHTWKIEATVINEELDDIGMVADFAVLKQHLRDILSELDHVCLNDLPFFKEVRPTSENIARYTYQRFNTAIAPLSLKRVQVWESDTSSVTYYE